MKIALVSYEYPPDTAVGGIATYMEQWARALTFRGHYVEVFAASPTRNTSQLENNINIHRIQCFSRTSFRKDIVQVFVKRHSKVTFDVLESPELNGDGLEIKRQLPKIILCVKLHTPSYLIEKLENEGNVVGWKTKFNFVVGMLLKFKWPQRYWSRNSGSKKVEREITDAAEVVTSPSFSLIDIVERDWHLKRKIYHLPNPYVPHNDFLNLDRKDKTLTVGFIGRLEVRKGIRLFANIIPEVISIFPDVQFLFAGKDCYLTTEKKLASDYIKDCCPNIGKNIKFLGHIKLDDLRSYFSQTDLIVLPSLWENFPTVCLEAMSAGQAVIGSNNGGMSDMIIPEVSGLLADPKNYHEFVTHICTLLGDKELRVQLGTQARERVLQEYSGERVVELFEEIIKSQKI